MDAINVGFQMKNYPTVQAYLSKAQNSPDGQDKAAISSKLKVVAALYALVTKKYHAAAVEFLQVGPDLGSGFNEVHASTLKTNGEVLSPNDVALYGALCAMASLDREELKTSLLDNVNFKGYLELEPHIREAAHAFYSAKYSITLEILRRHRSDFIVDPFLSSHVDALYRQIRQKVLVQAFKPYSTLELTTLSSLCSTPIEQLTIEIIGLIEDGEIKARLDHPRKVFS